jgi:hypothetical protein
MVERFPMGEWGVESLRLTLLGVSGELDWLNSWMSVAREPFAKKTETRDGPLELVGTLFDLGPLKLSTLPNRIDWHFGFIGAPETRLKDFPRSGSWSAVAPAFQKAMQQWLLSALSMEATRIGFGAVFTHDEADRESGYERLKAYLPFVPVGQDVADFLYQVNRRRDSSIAGASLKLNRLMRWSVVQLQPLAIEVAGGAVNLRKGEPRYATRLELDLSTPLERETPLERKLSAALLGELTQLAEELATEGDKD